MSSRVRSEFGTLAERSQAMTHPAPSTQAHPATQPRQHWVLIDGHEQGLLAKWRNDGTGGWEGLVARAGGADDLWAEWIPSTRLTPHTCP